MIPQVYAHSHHTEMAGPVCGLAVAPNCVQVLVPDARFGRSLTHRPAKAVGDVSKAAVGLSCKEKMAEEHEEHRCHKMFGCGV